MVFHLFLVDRLWSSIVCNVALDVSLVISGHRFVFNVFEVYVALLFLKGCSNECVVGWGEPILHAAFFLNHVFTSNGEYFLSFPS